VLIGLPEEAGELFERIRPAVLEAGLNCARARDRTEAVMMARALRPAVVLIHAAISPGGGIATLRDLRDDAAGPRVPTILLALDEEEDVTLAYELGAYDHLGSDLTAPVLMAKVKGMLRREERREEVTIPDLAPGSVLHERYRIVESIGSGGMADVYLADHRGLETRVALKVMRHHGAEGDLAVKRFEREVSALSSLRHRHIVAIYDAVLWGPVRYYAMEYLPGHSLARRLREGPLPPGHALRILRSVARGVAHAHRHRIIHRDLKAENILFAADGRAVVTDFGLHLKLDKKGPRLTKSGFRVGTPHHMSPEQIRDERLDERSDVYALGGVLYQMLTGRIPHQERSGRDAMVQIMHEDVAPPRLAVNDVPPLIEMVCLKALAREKQNRYGSALELAQAATDALDALGLDGPK
jgi:DNA-binding response OmpR family regulator